MNLYPLFELQAKLDRHVEEIHPRKPKENRLAKKILALKVEIGELANELPEVFKFWSFKKNNYERALKEYADCLHFILSIGLECNDHEYFTMVEPYQNSNDITEQFMAVFWFANQMEHYDLFHGLASNFLGLGQMIGFTEEEIVQAYLEKNAVNHQRQEKGY